MTKRQYFKVGETIKVKVDFSSACKGKTDYNEIRKYKILKTGRGIVFESNNKDKSIFSNERLKLKPGEHLNKTKITNYFNLNTPVKYTIL